MPGWTEGIVLSKGFVQMTVDFKTKYKTKYNGGFSLLEVLIALLILSIGLLGIAALQTVSLRSNHGAYQRSQATFLAYGIIDSIRANRDAALNDGYDIAIGATNTGTGIAGTDINTWRGNIRELLPDGDGSIACNGDGVCTITIQWDVSREGGTARASTVTQQEFTFMTEI